jgi:hypothetical protein
LSDAENSSVIPSLFFLPCAISQKSNKFCKKKNDKSIIIIGRVSPWGCEMSKLPHFVGNLFTDGGKMSSLRRQPPSGRFPVLISVQGCADPMAKVWLQGLGQLKNPMTSPGIEPAILRFVKGKVVLVLN